MEFLPPWDTFGLFDPPQVLFADLAVQGQVVAPADPQRVVLMFSNNDNSTADAAVKIYTTYDEANPIGINVPANAAPLIFTNRDHGSLTQIEWKAWSQLSTAYLVVIGLRLRQWPRKRVNVVKQMPLPPDLQGWNPRLNPDAR